MTDIRRILVELDEVDVKILELVKEKSGQVNLKMIADILKIDKATCSRHIKKLEQLGLIRCQELGPCKVPMLTALGLEVLRRLSPSST